MSAAVIAVRATINPPTMKFAHFHVDCQNLHPRYFERALGRYSPLPVDDIAAPPKFFSNPHNITNFLTSIRQTGSLHFGWSRTEEAAASTKRAGSALPSSWSSRKRRSDGYAATPEAAMAAFANSWRREGPPPRNGLSKKCNPRCS
jgi:hypothetical protein